MRAERWPGLPAEYHVQIPLKRFAVLNRRHREDAPCRGVRRIIAIEGPPLRESQKGPDRLEPHRNPSDAVAGYRGTEQAPGRIEQIDLRGRVDGHRAMGQFVQSGFIDLATLEQRQLSYHIRRNARIESLEYFVGVAAAGVAQQ